MEAVTLRCCNFMWIKGGHPCAKVRKAPDEAGVPYELAHNPQLRGRRIQLREKTGQSRLPAIEFADGRIHREQSRDMAARIAAGKLFES